MELDDNIVSGGVVYAMQHLLPNGIFLSSENFSII
jgi:hypothetical protein